MEYSDWYFRVLFVRVISASRFRRAAGLSSYIAFADADYASNDTDRRSVTGGAVICAGAWVCWFSRTQRSASHSRPLKLRM